MLARRRYVAFTPIPYGPFLVLGALLVYFGAGAHLLSLAPG
jgi:prepilin signal peptidase PulO-like enzyme (type II secretory pathway)